MHQRRKTARDPNGAYRSRWAARTSPELRDDAPQKPLCHHALYARTVAGTFVLPSLREHIRRFPRTCLSRSRPAAFDRRGNLDRDAVLRLICSSSGTGSKRTRAVYPSLSARSIPTRRRLRCGGPTARCACMVHHAESSCTVPSSDHISQAEIVYRFGEGLAGSGCGSPCPALDPPWIGIAHGNRSIPAYLPTAVSRG